ncbi:hypothetical protein ACKKBG_A19700 [Auxenochlorella protothecoides x Auxenochlorella symbiontica]|nr:hypothetical protein F751_2049 [Auxenochlorella protothecoides]KFM26963.1 hypothetical protein F751_2049 [Auxenochlorella protothecoides]RMZ56630.1 hypothetical protein APUTEX25_002719 [Auxenochlorella protothecoides]|eukprot:RMZ56630.1 hypothetical protein APUTEX25_002719 [Auxenochlorella protothecoides]
MPGRPNLGRLTAEDLTALRAEPRATAVLNFWFGEKWETEGLPNPTERLGVWYGKSDALDSSIRQSFGGDLDRLLEGRLDGWRSSLLPAVAGIILGDQFTRNARRGTASMYDADAKTLEWTHALIADGSIARLPYALRHFAAMPLMHSESLADQELILELLKRWHGELSSQGGDDEVVEFVQTAIPYAEGHVDVVRRWGRFPHRNAILGRPSTQEEEAGLRDGSIAAW